MLVPSSRLQSPSSPSQGLTSVIRMHPVPSQALQALARLLGKVMCRSVVSGGTESGVPSVCKVRWLSGCVWRAIDGAVGPHLTVNTVNTVNTWSHLTVNTTALLPIRRSDIIQLLRLISLKVSLIHRDGAEVENCGRNKSFLRPGWCSAVTTVINVLRSGRRRREFVYLFIYQIKPPSHNI